MKQLKGNRKKTLISANDDNKRKYKSQEKILEFAFFKRYLMRKEKLLHFLHRKIGAVM